MFIVAVALVAIPLVSQPSYAEPASRTSQQGLTDETRLATVRSSVLPARTMTGAQFVVEQALAGHSLSAAVRERAAKAVAPNSCASGGAVSSGYNVFGGMLYSLTLSISWCYDGSSVWAGGYTWSWSTGYGWSFNKWTNPPNDWYLSDYSQYHAVAQARFCVAWCAEDAYAGLEDIGTRSGAFEWHTI
jgi:hypothetical protein